MANNNKKINKVLEFRIDDSLLVERITGRRFHKASGRSYHVKYNPPLTEGVDNLTGEPLIQRKDDTEEILKNRLKNYHELTSPVLNYYKNRELLTTLDAKQPIETVWTRIQEVLD